MFKRTNYLIITLILSITVFIAANTALAAEYYRIAVISDLHLPSNKGMLKLQDSAKRERIIQAKQQAIADIDTWPDVDLIAITGDIVGTNGSDAEFAFAKQVFSNVHKPIAPILGNHDLMYSNKHKGKWSYTLSDPTLRQARINSFKQIFNLRNTYYSKQVNGYNLIFLSPDVLDTSNKPVMLSDKQLLWLDNLLSSNKQPTIIFCHAPLPGTFNIEDIHTAHPADEFVKPVEQISHIIQKHPQVFIWVAGHLHMSTKVPSFKSSVNLYQNQVMTVHNPDMNHQTIYTRSLYLYKTHVLVKTFNHQKQAFVDSLELTIKIPDKLK